MTVEELLMPRIKCTTKFLGMKREGWEVGTICEVTKDTDDAVFILSLPNQYPLNFKPLNWWEERKVEDMPEYVKVIANGCSFNAGTILKANNWGVYPDEGNNFGNEGDYYCLLITTEESSTHDKGEEVKMNMRNVLPATEQEYNDYINSNSNAKP